MLIDISAVDFEKMARMGFFQSVNLRAQTIETAQARCKALGLRCVTSTVYRTGDVEACVSDVHYTLVRLRSGIWLIRQGLSKKDGNRG